MKKYLCTEDGCERTAHTAKLCHMHLQMYKDERNITWRKRERHGMSQSSEFKTWHDMLVRCNNPNHRLYKYYGNRGIKVDSRWDKFSNFLKDMGERPSPTHSLDRIDNNADYKPDNCRWATKTQQVINRRTPVNNKTGVKGVMYLEKEKVFVAYLGIDRQRKHLGRYKTLYEAAKARKLAEVKYHKELTK